MGKQRKCRRRKNNGPPILNFVMITRKRCEGKGGGLWYEWRGGKKLGQERERTIQFLKPSRTMGLLINDGTNEFMLDFYCIQICIGKNIRISMLKNHSCRIYQYLNKLVLVLSNSCLFFGQTLTIDKNCNLFLCTIMASLIFSVEFKKI